MKAVRQKVRPKHQVLILKCYPRYQKNVAEVKPNSSELSYLTYYASTRRSKVQKVGEFLERKTASDVSKGKNGDVQVTLQIVKALIEKSPRDLPLYAPYVLNILAQILKSKDLNMAEDTIATFQTFCQFQDQATLAADQDRVRQWEFIVRTYAGYAGIMPSQIRSSEAVPTAIRWRTVGLKAIKAVTASEAISADGYRILNSIVPMLLENLYPGDEDRLMVVRRRIEADEKADEQIAIKRRVSVSTVRTTETEPNSDSAAISGSTAEADRLAEQENAALAMQSLKQLYECNNRGQIRVATITLLHYITQKTIPTRPNTARSNISGRTGSWTISLVDLVSKWGPVQDRFVILITAMETMIRAPLEEETLEQQLKLASLIEWLLSSNINMIGLSVMDVLLGLVQHILRLLRLGGKDTFLPQSQQPITIDLFNDITASTIQDALTSNDNEQSPNPSSPSNLRQELLLRLRKCIGNLATHVYYTDQISDMVIALLVRLKPSSIPRVRSTSAIIEDPSSLSQTTQDSSSQVDESSSDNFFSFGTARVTALEAIKDVLIIANSRQSSPGIRAIGRTKVGTQVWDGTQWLLRDEDKRVRRAYVAALITWLRFEMGKADLRVPQESPKISKSVLKQGDEGEPMSSLARRAASSASQRSKKAKAPRSTFLQLLHLAVYDNALEAPEANAEILLVHLLLVNLVQKLGVNAIKHGLPMVMKIQEDVMRGIQVSLVSGKVNLGTLVHAYLLTILEMFEIDSTIAGFEVTSEVSRRKRISLWLDPISLPPIPLDRIMAAATAASAQPAPASADSALRPFENLQGLVTQIAQAYSTSVSSPPASPPGSPGRAFSSPSISASQGSIGLAHELPDEYREAMITRWTKEACIASAEKEAARSSSVHGSRSGTTKTPGQGLGANNGNVLGDHSPAGAQTPSQLVVNKRGLITPQQKLSVLPVTYPNSRRGSGQDVSPATPIDSEDHTPVVRVDDLKRLLAGGAMAEVLSNRPSSSAVRTSSPLRTASVAAHDFGSPLPRQPPLLSGSVLSSGSDSIAEAEDFDSASEGDPGQPIPDPQSPAKPDELAQQHILEQQAAARASAELKEKAPRSSSTHRSSLQQRVGSRTGSRPASRGEWPMRPRSSSSASFEDPEANARALRGEVVGHVAGGPGRDDVDDIPPVPPLPPGLALSTNPQRVVPFGGVNGMSGEAAQQIQSPQGNVHQNMTQTTTSSDEPLAVAARALGLDGSTNDGADDAHGVGASNATSELTKPPESVKTTTTAIGSIGRSANQRRSRAQILLDGIEVGRPISRSGRGRGLGAPPY